MTNIYVRYPSDPNNNLPVGLDGYRKLDLYEDENMEFISKVNDITKLDKVFSDFSNSFTVPATANNTEIFRYYYDLDVDLEYTYNPNIKVDAYVEIDTIPYRYPQLQLESVKLKENRADSYAISVYSNITQLTDLFGEDLLQNLDVNPDDINNPFTNISQFNYTNSVSNYHNGYYRQDFNLGTDPQPWDSSGTLMPMINMSDRKWQLFPATPPNPEIQNITVEPFSAEFVRPAFRLIKFIEAIEKKYHVKFSTLVNGVETREFFGRAEFMNLFMWLNRKEEYTFTDYKHVEFTNALTPIGDGGTIPSRVILTTEGDIQATYNKRYYEDEGGTFDPTPDTALYRSYIEVKYELTPTPPGVPYTVRLYNEEGTILAGPLTFNGTVGKITFTKIGDYYSPSEKLATTTFKLQVKSSTAIDFVIDATFKAYNTYKFYPYGHHSDPEVVTIVSNVQTTGNAFNSLDKVNIAENIPEMKVVEFMQNIMKMFKLIIRPTAYNPNITEEKNGRFLITTLNSFYLNGEQKDLTQFIDFTEVNIKKPDIYKELSFKYADTENFLGAIYKKNDPDGRGYGDEKITFTDAQINTKNKLEVKIEWENMQFERLDTEIAGVRTGTNVMIGEAIKSDDEGVTFDKNASKTFLMYNMGVQSVLVGTPITLYPGFGNIPLQYLGIFGTSNDSIFPQVTQSINFSTVADQWHGQSIPQSLIETKWRLWLDEIYDFRQRKFAYKAVKLDPRIITSLDLADTVVIKDQIYKIDDMKINLSTGDATFNLFRTFKPAEIPTFFNPVVFGTPATGATTTDLEPLVFRDYIEDGETVLLAGNFLTVGGEDHRQLVKLDKAGNIIETFTTGFGFEVSVGDVIINKMLRIGDDLYVCGYFSSYDGVDVNNIVKINYHTGEIDTTFADNIGTGFDNNVTSMVDTGDGIVIGGGFTDFNGTPLTYLTKLNYDGTLWDILPYGPFIPVLDGLVTGLINLPSPFYAGFFNQVATGIFTTYYGNIVNGIVSFDSSAFQPNYGSYGGITSTTGSIFLEKALDDPNDRNFWTFGSLTSFNSVPVNNIALIDNGLVLSASVPLGGPNQSITYGKRVLGDKLLIQGQGDEGFTTFEVSPTAGITTRAAIITTSGQLYKTFPPESFAYNIGESFYSVDLTTNAVTGPTSDESTPAVNRLNITATPGEMYYGVVIQKKIGWIATKVDAGNGTDWIEFNNNTNFGDGFDECTFLVKSKMNEPGETITGNRSMIILFSFDDGTSTAVTVTQVGIDE